MYYYTIIDNVVLPCNDISIQYIKKIIYYLYIIFNK